MIEWKEFIKCNRGLLIAPAGHGKTTAIADCLLQCPESSCQLVLTHTHAGIASLRSKFHKKNVPSSRYHLETITGFAQRYVLNYLVRPLCLKKMSKTTLQLLLKSAANYCRLRLFKLLLNYLTMVFLSMNTKIVLSNSIV